MFAMKLLVPALLAAVALSPALAADWPFFRGPNRNGILAEKLDLLPGGAKKLWEAEVGKGNGGPAIAGRRVFISASKPDRGIACLDAETGSQIWLRPIDSWSLDPTPSSTTAKFSSSLQKKRPTRFGIDAASGRVLWDRELPNRRETVSMVTRAPRTSGGPVFFNAGGGVALKKNGRCGLVACRFPRPRHAGHVHVEKQTVRRHFRRRPPDRARGAHRTRAFPDSVGDGSRGQCV